MSKLGVSGQIAKRFLSTEITPLLALVGLLLGIFAVLVTPREEEPQINVTFANVFIPFPGATARELYEAQRVAAGYGRSRAGHRLPHGPASSVFGAGVCSLAHGPTTRLLRPSGVAQWRFIPGGVRVGCLQWGLGPPWSRRSRTP